MTKFYTFHADLETLKCLNIGGSGLSWRDKFAVKKFGGKIFTEDMFKTAIKKACQSRQNNLATQNMTPRHLWKWWYDRGAIIELS